MLSAKLLEDMEFLCRALRNKTLPFGGLQVVAVGSFKQLAPIPNSKYGDCGNYCFQSDMFDIIFPHRVALTQVKRTGNPKLISAVNDLCEGSVTKETETFLRQLKKPLDPIPENVTTLYSTNLDCCIYNFEKLTEDPSSVIFTFHAKDTGRKSALLKLSTPKKLQVKIGCPVIVTSNLSKDIVNGTQGILHATPSETNNAIVINVEGRLLHIHKKTIEVFDPLAKKDIACHCQYPLNLAYALTMHRVQGQTLQSAIIHCQGVFKPAQIGVALGRVTSADSVQLCNFNKSLVFKHPQCVYNFDANKSIPLNETTSCCNAKLQFPAINNEKVIKHRTLTTLTTPCIRKLHSEREVLHTATNEHDYSIMRPSSDEIFHTVRDKFTSYSEICAFIDNELNKDKLHEFISDLLKIAQENMKNLDKGLIFKYYNSTDGLKKRKKLFSNDDTLQHHTGFFTERTVQQCSTSFSTNTNT